MKDIRNDGAGKKWRNVVESKASRLMEGEKRLRRVAGIGKE